MKKNTLLIMILITYCLNCRAQQVLTCQDVLLSFFSSTPLEDIEGTSKTGASVINVSNGDIIFKVKNTSFQFEKKLMQEHFNENYMESEKYPLSEFRGKIEDAEKLAENGVHYLNVSGILTIHGVAKNYRTRAKMTVNNGLITATCSFDVRTADHKIKIPSILVKNIAEVMKVNISANYKNKPI
ncbi:YceI family protein [Olivibacter sp. SDN3]|uniref:YceI family protein n=1 Tax=Olivibacter sp. SDN3 TaxID=2764720 RepID=UPI0016511D45|nr:YceI family protein [Olivibacter sp. SDN3]QNL49876.1 YceI family protein [Olivibacter sp. SDN3]